MAPSTALLFVLYGSAAILRARWPLGRGAHHVGVAINSAGALIASLLLVLSFLGIRPAAERLGFAAAGTPGEAPVGHMSPVTAICFLLASLSFLASLPSSSSRPWRAAAAWWTAGLLLAASFVLRPVLSDFAARSSIPRPSSRPRRRPASPSRPWVRPCWPSPAGRAGSTGRTAGPPARVPRPLVLVFVLLAAGIVSVGGLYSRSDARRYRAEVERGLSAVAELKTGELAQWRAERLGDASLFLGNTPFSALVRRLFDDPQDAEAQAQLRTWLTKVQTHQLYDQISLLDAAGYRAAGGSRGAGPDLFRDREARARDPAVGRRDLRGLLSERARRARLSERPGPHPR